MEITPKTLHDGVLRCVLCATDAADAGHEWCPAAECLLCDGCCRSLLTGDPQVIISIIATSERLMNIEQLAGTCQSCSRADHNALDGIEDEDFGPVC